MNLSHPNILELIGVDIDPQTGQYSMISEMMINGNIREYIRKNSANRFRLVRRLSELYSRYLPHILHSYGMPLQVYVTSTNVGSSTGT